MTFLYSFSIGNQKVCQEWKTKQNKTKKKTINKTSRKEAESRDNQNGD